MHTGDDLILDGVAVLDALGVERAHVVRISMAGAIAQRIAVQHPAQVLTLTLIWHQPRRQRRA